MDTTNRRGFLGKLMAALATVAGAAVGTKAAPRVIDQRLTPAAAQALVNETGYPLTTLGGVRYHPKTTEAIVDKETGIAIRFVKQFDVVPDPNPARADLYFNPDAFKLVSDELPPWPFTKESLKASAQALADHIDAEAMQACQAEWMRLNESPALSSLSRVAHFNSETFKIAYLEDTASWDPSGRQTARRPHRPHIQTGSNGQPRPRVFLSDDCTQFVDFPTVAAAEQWIRDLEEDNIRIYGGNSAEYWYDSKRYAKP